MQVFVNDIGMHIDASMKAANVTQSSLHTEGSLLSGGGTTNTNAGVATTTSSANVASTVTGTPLRSRNQSRLDKQQQEEKPENVSVPKGKTPTKPPEEFYRDLQQFHDKRG